ncbi:Sodium/hydrogen exchanger family protein [Apiospora saccharicola]|uniref:Sodium/hydrogen exchanger family protein n=1 Tax=Apiospora saccharicola TaxID=335842 RepID=A0ABR1UN30_9PEZI
MPSLDVSELNIVISVFGSFIILYGFASVKIKQVWFLGEALPAVILGIVLGPLAARFIDAERWGSAAPEQQNAITLGVTRVMIGLQLVIAGFQLPAKYQLTRWKEMLLCLIPIMTVMWLCTTACILLTIPKLTLLAALVIGSCVTCTDPILSQAIAKGPFADRYVTRDLREIISSEAGANDGFGFPFLMLAVYLMRHSELGADVTSHEGVARRSEEEVGRLGGGIGLALGNWAVETWLYIVLLSIAYGAVVGYGCQKMTKFSLRKQWIDSESYLLYPTAMGLFLVGTCGAIGTDDLLACFVAGNALNWDGQFLEETEKRHDEVNSSIDVLLNFGGFLYIGTILPWGEFHQPELTGITYPRLVGLGFLVLVLRRIPAILVFYKCMPHVCKNIKEALFMGYFGPIGAGAVFYLEHTRHLFPKVEKADQGETNMLRAIGPVVYWLVLFSIVVHGLSIPALNLVYRWYGVPPISTDAVEIKRSSVYVPAPANAVANGSQTFLAYNRFSRPVFNQAAVLPRWQQGGKTWDDDDDAENFVEILDKSK